MLSNALGIRNFQIKKGVENIIALLFEIQVGKRLWISDRLVCICNRSDISCK